MKNTPLIIERIYNAPIEKVWHAITDCDAMKHWFFDLPEFKLEIGFPFQFYAGREGSTQYLHLCEITEIIPGKKLTYSWRYDGYPGMSYITLELFAEGTQTRLKFTHAGIETFPADNPDLSLENFSEGWNFMINELLKDFVE